MRFSFLNVILGTDLISFCIIKECFRLKIWWINLCDQDLELLLRFSRLISQKIKHTCLLSIIPSNFLLFSIFCEKVWLFISTIPSFLADIFEKCLFSLIAWLFLIGLAFVKGASRWATSPDRFCRSWWFHTDLIAWI